MNLTRLHELPTDKQLEVFYMLHQIRSQQYEHQPTNLGNIVLSALNRNTQLSLSDDQLTVYGTQGYRTALATHGVAQGTYYYECAYEFPKNYSPDTQLSKAYQPQVRVGFATPAAHLDGPVGFDKYGFGLRSADCSICHQRERLLNSEQFKSKSYKSFQISPGQVIGCLICLPPFVPKVELPPETEMCQTRQAQVVSCKRKVDDDSVLPTQLQQQFEVPDEVVPGSFIRFYVDGAVVSEIREVAYNRYYPAISCYNYAQCTCNFGVKNQRIDGYPNDFYALAPCLVSGEQMLKSEGAEDGFGKGKMNLENILKDEDERLRKIEEEKAAQVKVDPDKIGQVLQLELKADDRPLEKSDLKIEKSEIKFESVNRSQELLSSTPLHDNEENDELMLASQRISADDLIRLGQPKSDVKQFLKFVLADQQEERGEAKSVFAGFSNEEIAKRGFKFPPTDNDFVPFTNLYKIRSEIDYQKTIQCIRDGIYTADLHQAIARLMHEGAAQREKRTKK